MRHRRSALPLLRTARVRVPLYVLPSPPSSSAFLRDRLLFSRLYASPVNPRLQPLIRTRPRLQNFERQKIAPPNTSRPPFAADSPHLIVPSSSKRIADIGGFWAKLRMRLKLFFMGPRSRPWKVDDLLAVVSLFGVGTSVFLLVGTTTAVSLFIAATNSINLQEFVAEQISEYLSDETGFEISYEPTLVPRWREGAIRLRNVRLVCTGDTYLARLRKSNADLTREEVDLNWTYWDTNVESIDVTLSLRQWLDGRGFIKACRMKGVRGVVDRRHIFWDPDWVPTLRDPLPNDFAMDKFVVEDLLLTILNPNFRPYTVSVFFGELPLFRQQWLLYDLMCADSIVGTFDDCLFSVHRTQDPAVDLSESLSHGRKKEEWGKMSHLKINGVPIEHMNAGVTGPFGWIISGQVDVDFHLFIPQISDGRLLSFLKGGIQDARGAALAKLDSIFGDPVPYRKLEEAALLPEYQMSILSHAATDTEVSNLPSDDDIASDDKNHSLMGESPATAIPIPTSERRSDVKTVRIPSVPLEGPPVVPFYCRVSLNDLRASVPLSTPDISYMNNAVIRPIVGYLNAHRLKIPLSFEGKLPLANFDGAWTFHSAGLIDLVGEEIGRAVTQLVLDERDRTQRLARVGVWSVQNVTKSMMNALDYARGTKGWEDWTLHYGSPWYSPDV